MPLRRPHRLAFSLIELLIVVALISALVGVAVPMFQQNLLESKQAKARSDLDTIRGAILQHDAHERPLTGTNLEPLHGTYLQNIPKDPWGNDYAVDLDVGVIMCLGGDGSIGGKDEDADMVLHFRSELKLGKVAYVGPYGIPTLENKIRVHWSKGYSLATGDPLPDLVLVIDGQRSVVIPMTGGGGPTVDKQGAVGGAPPADLANQTWGGTTWAYAPGESDPSNGLMIINCTQGAALATAGDNTVRVTPHAALNVKWSVAGSDPTSSTSVIKERPATGGPLDPARFGPNALAPHAAIPNEMVGDENRGVLFQRE